MTNTDPNAPGPPRPAHSPARSLSAGDPQDAAPTQSQAPPPAEAPPLTPALNPRASIPIPVPSRCPLCDAPATRASSFDSRSALGWRCASAGSLHFWEARGAAFRCWLTTRRYLISPSAARDGAPPYPGLTLEDVEAAHREMQANRACWRAQGYDPNA